jgi:hypothetical protein
MILSFNIIISAQNGSSLYVTQYPAGTVFNKNKPLGRRWRVQRNCSFPYYRRM